MRAAAYRQRPWRDGAGPARLFALLLLGLLGGCAGLAGRAGHAFQDCDACPEMIVVPAGRFTMGAPETESQGRRFGWGGPPIEVSIGEPFALARTEITRGQYAAFVAATGYEPDGRCRSIWENRLPPGAQPDWRDPLWPDGSRIDDRHPAVCIGHPDAEAYVAWLNSIAGGKRRYFLPSEAQWEYAARAGSRGLRHWESAAPATAQACAHANLGDRRYGALFPQYPTVDCDDGHAFTAPVAGYPPNAFGLYDMLGNVWEWVADCASADLGAHPRDGRPLTADMAGADCTRRAMRGAGFPSADWYLRVTTRGGDPVPRTRLVVIGFRVAATVQSK